MDRKYSKLGLNIIWMILGNFASKFLLFFLIPIYTSLLSTSEYGIADLISTTVSLATPIFSLLISESILRFSLDKKFDTNQVFTISMLIIFIGFGVLVILSPIFMLSKTLKPYILEFLLYYFFSVVATTLQQFLKGIEHVKIFVISGIINTVVNIICNIVFLFKFHLGIRGYLVAIILGNTVTTLFITIYEKLWKYFIKIILIDRTLIKSTLQYTIPLIPNSLSWWISNSFDKYMLTIFCGTAINGIYSIAYKIPSLMTVISSIFTSAWQISVVEDFGSKESEKFFSNIYRKYSSLYILITSSVILFIKAIASFIFSNEFYVAWKYACILVIASMFQSLCSFLGSIYTTAMKTRMIFVTTMAGAVCNTVFNFLFIPCYDAYGAAFATLISYMMIWIIRLVDSRKILKIQTQIEKDLLSYLIIGIECICMCSEISYAYFICSICLLVITILNKEVLIDLYNVIRKKII